MPKNGSAMMYTSGWPKNQNRCCHSIGPPFSAGVDQRTQVPVGQQRQQRRGQDREGEQDQDRRHQGVPGEDRHPEHRHARRAQADDGGDEVDATQDRAQTRDRQAADPQVRPHTRGVHHVGQRRVGGPAEVRRATGGDEARTPRWWSRTGTARTRSAFSRGNATSGAPICSGMIRFPNAKNSGVANISSISVPCIVNSWLYCSGDRNCSSGRPSSARISMAIRPPRMKKTNDVVRYIRPMVLWSVVRSRFDSREPFSTT